MTYEVVVVGGGIGGLTAAALLAARGLSVCLLERASQLGGCTAPSQKFGYTFEPGAGFYGGWQTDAIHQRVFAELPVNPPHTRLLDPGYVVRLPDHSEIAVSANTDSFEHTLSTTFPECAAEAIRFYRSLVPIGNSLTRALQRVPDLYTAGKVRRLAAFSSEPLAAFRIAKLRQQSTTQFLSATSDRFRTFIDIQLQALAQSSASDCSLLYAAVLLGAARGHLFSIDGGVSALTEGLAKSIKQSGGKIRLDTPVLRLAYDAHGTAVGVDLLSGERINASKAIVSNLTVWDTYGKLVGMSRTPAALRKELTAMLGTGAYLIYAGVAESVAQRLPATLLTQTDSYDAQGDQEKVHLTVHIYSESEARAPSGKRGVTILTPTDVNDWFTYHEDESEHESRDQSMLEKCWQALHLALPELGDEIEVIDTVTPRVFYEQTRRKLGMVGAVTNYYVLQPSKLLSHLTSVPNLFRVGDTAFPGAGVAAATHSALIVANSLTS